MTQHCLDCGRAIDRRGRSFRCYHHAAKDRRRKQIVKLNREGGRSTTARRKALAALERMGL